MKTLNLRNSSASLLFIALFVSSIIGHPQQALASATASSTPVIVTPTVPTTPTEPTVPTNPATTTAPTPPVSPVEPGSGSTTPATGPTNPTAPTCPTNPTNPTNPTGVTGTASTTVNLTVPTAQFDLSVAFSASTTCPNTGTGGTGTTTNPGGGTGTTTDSGGTGTTTDSGNGGGTGTTTTATTTDSGSGGGTGTTTASTTDSGGTTSGGGGGGGGGGGTSGTSGSGGGGGGSGSSGRVLGASCTIINSYMRQTQVNDSSDVIKLKSFLDTEMGFSLPVDSVFDTATTEAVNAFQVKYWQDVLSPWVPFGLATDHTPTGYVYKTTQWKINSIACPGLNASFPVLP